MTHQITKVDVIMNTKYESPYYPELEDIEQGVIYYNYWDPGDPGNRHDHMALSKRDGEALRTLGEKGMPRHSEAKLLCPCGCRRMHWIRENHTFKINDDETITISPSIGAHLLPDTCGAHYWITSNKIVWCEPRPRAAQ